MSLEGKKLKVQIKKVDAAIEEMEYKTEQRLDEIKRITEHIEIQKQTKIDLENKLKELGE